MSTAHSPRTAEFLRFVRLHADKNPCCDPLDGQVHNLKEVTRWIGIRELALRFIGLGVILGVFELVQPWVRREQENYEDTIGRLERDNDAQFRSKVYQVPSNSSISTKAVSRSGGATTCSPIVVQSRSKRACATLPRSSSTITPRERSLSREARQLTCPNAWRTSRSARPHRV